MPSRNEALTALLSVQNKPVVKVEQPETARRQSGVVGVVGNAFSRVRDRQNAEANQPVEQKKESLFEQECRLFGREWAERYERQRQQEAREKAAEEEKKRKRGEQRDLELKRRLREENDRKTLEAHRQCTVDTIFANEARREVRQILQDASAEEITLVLKKIEAAHCKGFVQAYQVFLDEVRQERLGEKRNE